MKQEERILRALGNVKDSFVLEASQHMGNPQEGVLVRPKKEKWKRLAGLAAAAALMVTGVAGYVSLLAGRQTGLPWASYSAVITVAENTLRNVVLVTEKSEGDCRAIREIQVFDGKALTQSISQEALPDGNQGLFVDLSQPKGQPDCRDLNFDGYTDLGFPAIQGTAQNVPYRYFLWDPETERFEYGFTLCGATALTLDLERQLLIETVWEDGRETRNLYRCQDGELRDVLAEDTSLPFTIAYDAEELTLSMKDGDYFLTPKDYADYLPPREIQIEFLPGLLPYAAMEQTKAQLEGSSITTNLDQGTGVYYLHVPYAQASWDAEMSDVWIVSAGVQGSYRLTARYFLEAAEGWGMTFSQICGSFQCPLGDSANPEAEKVFMDFAEGYFTRNERFMQRNYYGSSQALKDLYTQDPSRVRLVSLLNLDTLDSQIEAQGFGQVSLIFLETEAADSYTYLSMEVLKTEAGYRISSYGLEK